MNYQIIPHGGDWRTAGVWHEHQKTLHQPIPQRTIGVSRTPLSFELVRTEGQIEMSAAYLDSTGCLIARFFNPGEAVTARIHIASFIAGLVEHIKLDGSVISRLMINHSPEDAFIDIPMANFGIETLRITK
ncbi:hypothetical protein FACS1894184_16680 [Clostridia bacterium]|nr:hypothetical protein FACS1894184_16680 [Clostridia bacterium]